MATRRRKRNVSSIPGLDKWSRFAGGTAAAPGKHGYDLRAGGQTYTIQPISSQYGRHLGYRLTAYPGVPAHGHQQIGGLHRSPQLAVKAAREWAARQQNPRRREYYVGGTESMYPTLRAAKKAAKKEADERGRTVIIEDARTEKVVARVSPGSENPRASVARIPSTWTPARVTRLKTGQIQLRIGRRAGR
jgi:hypothetical protein